MNSTKTKEETKTETKTIINKMNKEGENDMLHMLEEKLEDVMDNEKFFCAVMCAGGSECRNVIENFEYELYENRLILHMDDYELYADFNQIELFHNGNKEALLLKQDGRDDIYTELYF